MREDPRLRGAKAGREAQEVNPPAAKRFAGKDEVPITERDHKGVIVRTYDQYCFIHSDELKDALGGKNIFVHPNDVGRELFDKLVVDTPVRFRCSERNF